MNGYTVGTLNFAATNTQVFTMVSLDDSLYGEDTSRFDVVYLVVIPYHRSFQLFDCYYYFKTKMEIHVKLYGRTS